MLKINQIVSVGSIDGILTSAALLRLIRLNGGTNEVGLVFTQAFTVDKIDPSSWLPERNVALVDLAVNNRNPGMTADFVSRLKAAGHKLVAVCDEHSREDWQSVLGSFEGLVIEPQSQSEPDAPKSSGELLQRLVCLKLLKADTQVFELLVDANGADNMNFEGLFSGPANKAVKSAIADDQRRVHIARWFAENSTPSPEMDDWIDEYYAIIANHEIILRDREDLRDGIIRVVTVGHKIDVTTLMKTLYDLGARVVIMVGEAFVPAKKCKEILVSFGTQEKVDLMQIVKSAGVTPLGGFAQKVNVALEDEVSATRAIRKVLLGECDVLSAL